MLSNLKMWCHLRPRRPIRRAALVLAGALILVAIGGVGFVAAATRPPHGPARCGSFAVPGAVIEVTVASGQVGCTIARRVLQDFWTGHGKYHGAKHRRRGYTTIGHWRCPDISPGLSQCAQRGKVVEGTYAVGKVAGR